MPLGQKTATEVESGSVELAENIDLGGTRYIMN